MGNFPVVHEVSTTFQYVGDKITGDSKKANQRWVDYSEQSVIGSGVYAAVVACQGDLKRAKQLGKGMGRATGSALLGGGILKNIPVFTELSLVGDCLGNCIAGDVENCQQVAEQYLKQSVIGGLGASITYKICGQEDLANEHLKCAGKSFVSGVTTATFIGVSIATGGMAAPAGMVVAGLAGGVVGASTSTVCTYVDGKLYDKNLSGGDYLGGALMGAVQGAASGCYGAYKYAKDVKLAEIQNQNLQNAEKAFGPKEKLINKSVVTQLHGENEISTGINRGQRIQNAINDKALIKRLWEQYNSDKIDKIDINKFKSTCSKFIEAEVEKLSFPKGTDRVAHYQSQDIVQKNLNQKALQEHVGNGKTGPMVNCAEAHALENMKFQEPVLENYTLQYEKGVIRVKGACENCQAMGKVNAYGKAPFDNIHCRDLTVQEAVQKNLQMAKDSKSTTQIIDLTKPQNAGKTISSENKSMKKKKN